MLKATKRLFITTMLAGAMISTASALDTVEIKNIEGNDSKLMNVKITQVVKQSPAKQRVNLVENYYYIDEDGLSQVDNNKFVNSSVQDLIVYDVLPDFSVFAGSADTPYTKDMFDVYYYDYVSSDDVSGYLCVGEGYAGDEDTVQKMLKHDLSFFHAGLYYGTDTPVAIRVTPEATATTADLYVNGQKVSLDAYNIMGNNYFKLRDIAMAIKGTEKNFDVTWDSQKRAVNLISDKAYNAVGGELEKGDIKNQYVAKSSSLIYKDGDNIDPMAYIISGNNYFKLRDLGEIFNFAVKWDSNSKTINIDTTESYSAD